jgi:AraC family transcriptional regulator
LFASRVQTLHRRRASLRIAQPCRAKLRWHEHELAYVTVVLEGDYLEGDRGRLEDLCAFIAAFNPAVGCNNETVIGPSGASFFTIELRDQRRKELRLRGHAVARTSHVSLNTQTSDALLAGKRRAGIAGGDRAIQLWRENCTPVARPGEGTNARRIFRHDQDVHLADEAGVHPVHLARAFRRTERLTPGE